MPKPLAMIFSGDRDWSDWQAVLDTMDKFQPSIVIEGEARGLDRMAGICADFMGIQLIPMPADWDKHHRAAGPIRNRAMLNRLLTFSHTHKLAVAFFHDDLAKSRGTKNMLEQTKKAVRNGAKIKCYHIHHRKKKIGHRTT